MNHGIGAGCDGQRFSYRCESRGIDLEAVEADGRLGQFKRSVGVCGGIQGKCGIGSLERDAGVGDGPVLRIVHHSAHGSEDRGESGQGSGEYEKRSKTI